MARQSRTFTASLTPDLFTAMEGARGEVPRSRFIGEDLEMFLERPSGFRDRLKRAIREVLREEGVLRSSP